MKKVILLSALASFLFIIACEGPVGPQGPMGPQGQQGPEGAPGEIGFVFEYDSINFTANDFSVRLDYPQDFEGLDSDVGLVYLLWDVVDGVEVWRPLPMDIFFPDGILQYNFDYTKFYVDLYLDGTVDLFSLGSEHTDQWVARVVIVPGDFWNSGRIDFSDYNAVKEALGLPEMKKHTKIYSRE